MKKLDKYLKAFEMHGVGFINETESQLNGDCPFCGKEKHFYVHKTKYLWDCKICGISGNYKSFLKEIQKRNKKNIEEKNIKLLAKKKGLPVSAFLNLELGFWNGMYTLPVYTEENKLQDIRCYKLNHKFISTSGAKSGLFGLNKLLKNPEAPVYICEGEWDTIAMSSLLKKAKIKGVAVCSPGATTFKEEWVPYFKNKKVFVCYDNDEAGLKGHEIVFKKLNGIASSLRFINWPDKKGIGYDIRDFYQDIYLKTKKPKTAVQKLLGLMRKTIKGQIEEAEEIDIKDIPKIDKSIRLNDVQKSIEVKMFDPDMNIFKAIACAILSTQFNTKPIWLFLVAPPSSGKTEMLNSFKYLGEPYSDLIHYTSSITDNTLISGMNAKKDPSLLAQFEGKKKALIIKDLTPILSYADYIKQEIFGQLRDIYDGYTAKDFGNGVKRVYRNLKFPILAGVTPEIYKETEQFAALGERFAKLQLRSSDHLADVMKMMHLNMKNIGKEIELDDHHAKVVYSYINNLFSWIEEEKIELPPPIPKKFYSQLCYLSLYTSRMRGSVSRDKFKFDLINLKPSKEKPMRFNLMISTIASYEPLLYFSKEVTQRSIDFARQIALNTVNPREEEILRTVYKLNQEYREAPSEFSRPNKKNIHRNCSYTPFTIERVLQNFIMLDILTIHKSSRQTLYHISKDMNKILVEGNIYQSKEELDRKNLIIDDIQPDYHKPKKKKIIKIKRKKKK
jgi:ribosomal protein L37AE/L43A